MGLLSKAYKGLKHLSRGKSACKTVCQDTRSSGPEPSAAHDRDLIISASVAPATRDLEPADLAARHSVGRPPADCWTSTGCFSRESVVNVTDLSPSCQLLGVDGLAQTTAAAGTADVQMLSTSVRGGEAAGVRNLYSESDSGVCLSESEAGDEATSECADEDFEDEYECECEECAFARCQYVLEDWQIAAKELTLDKVLSSQPGETVYRYVLNLYIQQCEIVTCNAAA